MRTIYRDVAELQMQNVPIVGEAGIGYVLKPGFDLPPLMLTPEELEAAMLGAQWVARSGDRSLAANAQSLLSKIHSVIPEQLQHVVSASTSTVVRQHHAVEDRIDLEALRHAMYQQRKALNEAYGIKLDQTANFVITAVKKLKIALRFNTLHINQRLNSQFLRSCVYIGFPLTAAPLP